jgi:cytochrome c oxidase subunit 2
MRFALLAVGAIAWSLTTLRWSVARRNSPWRLRLVVVSTVTLVLAVISAAADLQSIWAAARAPSSGVTIAINDEREWWQLAYSRNSQSFITANEVHVPAGTVVTMQWSGSPVVVWRVRDFFPQELGTFRFVAGEAGIDDLLVVRLWPPSRRHLQIVADPTASFDRWFAAQMSPARPDARSAALFTSAGCSYCHVIRGAAESPWKVAPELTHFGSRRTIAAIAMPNRRGYLAGWIVQSHALKRGSEMPENNVRADVLSGLLDYLQSLR